MNLFGPFFVDYIRFFAKKNLELISLTRLISNLGSATAFINILRFSIR
jgi:hypothetical protein